MPRALTMTPRGRPCIARALLATLDHVPREESPSTTLPNALISPLPREHVPLETSFSGDGRWSIFHEWG